LSKDPQLYANFWESLSFIVEDIFVKRPWKKSVV